ncbi:MAG TPA: alpha-hydroxy acid oxidase [Candidatus Binatia bacterium]|nr:alpha-hydroxy acid oxidase [Candidatus Binatia bacterium]
MRRSAIYKMRFGSVSDMFERRMLQKVRTLTDMEALSEKRMTHIAHAYLSGGAGDEITLRANSAQWAQILLNPNILEDVSEIDLTTEILGQSLDVPILLAPAAIHRLWHRKGEMAVVAGANQAKVTLVTSTFATESVENICRAATQPVWFQLYTRPEREFNQSLIQRAEAAGCKAIAITVDTPTIGIRNREERAYFRMPPNFNLPNINIGAEIHRRAPDHAFSLVPNAKLTWKEIEWMCSIAKTPVWLKGVINPQDALRAVDSGAAGIIVSNHGARNLDTLPSTAEALPRIVEKLQGRLPLMVDGGIRRGTDILKALAMGAKAVLIGRPYLHGVAAAGSDGVARVIAILRTELRSAMALTGRTKIAQIDPSVLWKR